MSISEHVMSHPNIPILRAVSRWIIGQGIKYGWDIADEDHLEQLSETSQMGIFYRVSVVMDNSFTLNFVALVHNDFEATLFMEAGSCVSWIMSLVRSSFDEHRGEYPHMIGM